MKKILLVVAIACGLAMSATGAAVAADQNDKAPQPVPQKDQAQPVKQPVKKDKLPPKGKVAPAPAPKPKPAPNQPKVDEHPPKIGVVTTTVWVTVRRWPGNVWVTVPVTRTDYIVVYWNPALSCYGVWDAWGNFHPYFGPLLGPAQQPQ